VTPNGAEKENVLRGVAVALTVLFMLTGGRAQDGSVLHDLYERADGIFDAARLLKPAEGADVNAMRLAPLLMLEVDASAEAAPEDSLTVYYDRSHVDVGGRAAEQWTYLWSDPDSSVQGIRMTLQADGFPATYEVLRDTSGARPVFVSTTLETEAADRLGPPLPGRRFSIEPSVEKTPRVVVPGVLEPGPMPLGPFVYLTKKTNDVASVVCRCMPSQVESVLGSSEYKLEPLGDSLERFDRPPVVLRLPAPS
jgi:hypothetical protein